MTSENLPRINQGINIKGGQPIIKDNTFIFESPKQNSPNNILYSGSANFVGREYELSQLSEKLQKPSVVAISAVSGMGGVGKTELAVRYARQHEADYSGGICWLNARDTNLAEEIVQFTQLCMNLKVPQELQGRQLRLEQQVEWCWQNWQPTEGLVLVVLDDVTDLKSCRKILPKANRFRVLMTTRLRRLDTNFVEISLDVLSKEDALKLLIGVLGEQDQRVKKDSQAAESLCAWLGYLPLGLELVGRYLVEDPDLSLTEMLRRLKAQPLQDDAIDPSEEQLLDTEMTAKRGVKAAFELSWLELNSHTQHVGELLSLFAPDVIPWKSVESIGEFLFWEKDLNEPKKQLYKRHLIQKLADKESAAYKIHPLIREFLKVKLKASEQCDDFKHAFVKTFVRNAKKIPQFPSQKEIELVQDDIPHLTEVAQNLINSVSNEDLIWPFVGLGRYYEVQGLYKQATFWYEQCLSIVQGRLENNDPDITQSFDNLSRIYCLQGQYKDAKAFLQEVLKRRLQLWKEEHFLVIASYNDLATIYYYLGQYSDTEKLYKKVLELGQQQGQDCLNPTIYHNLACLYHDLSKYTEAECFYKKSQNIYLEQQGENHPYIPNSYNSLALVYVAEGKYKEAELLFKKALKLIKQRRGKEHLDVADSYNNLATVYHKQGRYIKAEHLLKKQFNLNEKLKKFFLTENNLLFAKYYGCLATLKADQGRYAEAESLYKIQLDIYSKNQLEENHPNNTRVYNNLALLYYRQNRYVEAEELFKKSLKLRQELLGEKHPDVAMSYSCLAEVYHSQKQYTEAEELFEKSLKLRQELLGEKHPDVAMNYNRLAKLYHSQKRYTEAEELFKKSLKLRQELLGEKHPDVAMSYSCLAEVYHSQKQYTEAEELFEKSLKLRQELLGEKHPDVAMSYSCLAEVYHSQKRYTEAEELFKKSLKLRQELLGEKHPDVAMSYNCLAELYHSQKRYTEAEELYQKASAIWSS